jgi:hypothetical protein
MQRIVGYIEIKKDSIILNKNKFKNTIYSVIEFTSDGNALITNRNINKTILVDKSDIRRKFECEEYRDCIVPPNLTEYEKLIYYNKMRKAKYCNNDIKSMVINAGLTFGEFIDEFLWITKKIKQKKII